eukprot:CAMPEP_0174744720 /NCGR_PEP_ID=MMETSP1094-20130205/85089_1 /TAXON_ID=156173 /ORGANISM="Chrysochromulina brevifilum, Strain UTEX LB 985" /LENGTH=149 /DNA_ID=CAMNT_0015949151 /DNA_START=1 /DNA_END=451 /DNA_ORIENTATION=+
MSVLYMLPIAVFGHILFAMFFYSKQANQPVPVAYYAALTFLAAFVVVRINAELKRQSQNFRSEAYAAEDGHEMEEASSASRPSTELRHHLENIEMYVPPLAHTLLKHIYATSAANSDPSSRAVFAPMPAQWLGVAVSSGRAPEKNGARI